MIYCTIDLAKGILIIFLKVMYPLQEYSCKISLTIRAFMQPRYTFISFWFDWRRSRRRNCSSRGGSMWIGNSWGCCSQEALCCGFFLSGRQFCKVQDHVPSGECIHSGAWLGSPLSPQVCCRVSVLKCVLVPHHYSGRRQLLEVRFTDPV